MDLKKFKAKMEEASIIYVPSEDQEYFVNGQDSTGYMVMKIPFKGSKVICSFIAWESEIDPDEVEFYKAVRF